MLRRKTRNDSPRQSQDRYVCIHTHIDLRVYVHTHVCVYMHVHVCMHTHIHTYIHLYMSSLSSFKRTKVVENLKIVSSQTVLV